MATSFFIRLAVAAVIVMSLMPPAPARADVEGSYFAIIVNDIDASVAWYESTLQLDRVSSGKTDRFEIVNLQGRGLFVELIELRSAAERPGGRIKGPFKLGILVDDLESFVQELPESMPEPDIVGDEANKLRLVQLRDPDGNIIQVMDFD